MLKLLTIICGVAPITHGVALLLAGSHWPAGGFIAVGTIVVLYGLIFVDFDFGTIEPGGTIMTYSEIHQRRNIIVLPLDSHAEAGLRSESPHPQRVRVLDIPADVPYELWHANLWQKINSTCGTMIDEHEEAWIDPNSLGHVLAAIDSIVARQGTLAAFLRDFHALATLAKSRSRPLLVVL